MKTVAELLRLRPVRVVSVKPEDSVLEAIKILARENVGAAVVMVGDRLAGIFSERDYTRKVILKGRSSDSTRVEEIMTANVVVVSPRTKTRDCMALMTEKNIRHLPVVEDGKLLGLVSIGDLVKVKLSEAAEEAQALRAYITS